MLELRLRDVVYDASDVSNVGGGPALMVPVVMTMVITVGLAMGFCFHVKCHTDLGNAVLG